MKEMIAAEHLHNINVGIMGHVDAGKTTLARLVSTNASTASFDHSPQSQARGMTLDLGFSSLVLGEGHLQVTLVDCPGHASLFRTVIGGAHIIDAVLLVVDATKGLQTQTAECLVLAEILARPLILVLTKIDLFLPLESRPAQVAQRVEQLRLQLSRTRFSSVPILPFSARLAGSRESLLHALSQLFPSPPQRNMQGLPLVAVDHCFAIKGQGTIMTGTVLRGQLRVDDVLEIPQAKCQRRIKSLQSFKRAIHAAGTGDRIGIGVMGALESSLIERTLIGVPGSIRTARWFLMQANPIRHYRHPCHSHARIHLSVLHETILATVIFMRPTGGNGNLYQSRQLDRNHNLDQNQDPHQNLNIYTESSQEHKDYEEYEHAEELFFSSQEEIAPDEPFLALVESPKPLVIFPGLVAIASKLDSPPHCKACRLAFWGKIVRVDDQLATLPQRIFRWRERIARVDRIVDDSRLIGRDLVSQRAALAKFIGKPCHVLGPTGEIMATGRIDSSFGARGNFQVILDNGQNQLGKHRLEEMRIEVRFKKYLQ